MSINLNSNQTGMRTEADDVDRIDTATQRNSQTNDQIRVRHVIGAPSLIPTSHAGSRRNLYGNRASARNSSLSRPNNGTALNNRYLRTDTRPNHTIPSTSCILPISQSKGYQSAQAAIKKCIESQSKRLALSNLELTSEELTTLLELHYNELAPITFLGLGNNKLKTVPEKIWELTNLEKLNLGFNQITTLSDEIKNLQNLSQLGLNNNAMNTIPDAIWDLKKITHLNLSSNPLTSLSSEISKLTKLSFLGLMGCCLETLPENFGDLTQLQRLQLRNNRLTTLPTSIGKLSQLERLGLGENPLNDLPKSITQLSPECRIQLDNNSLIRNIVTGLQHAITVGHKDCPSRGPQFELSMSQNKTHVTLPLVAEVASWHEESGIPFSDENKQQWALFAETTDGAEAFSNQLGRLRLTAHYDRFPQDMRQRVVTALQALCDLPEARAACFAQAVEGSESCDDRIALAFISIEEAILSYRAANENWGQTELLKTAKGLYRSRNLQDIALSKAKDDPGIVDQTEVVLRYWISLSCSDQLNLPSKMADMIFTDWAKSVTTEDIQLAKEQVIKLDQGNQFSEFLGTWHPWQTYLEKNHPQDFAQAQESIKHQKQKLQDQLNAQLNDETISENALLQSSTVLKQKYAQTESLVFGELSRKIINKL